MDSPNDPRISQDTFVGSNRARVRNRTCPNASCAADGLDARLNLSSLIMFRVNERSNLELLQRVVLTLKLVLQVQPLNSPQGIDSNKTLVIYE